jgi:hypothetical protein
MAYDERRQNGEGGKLQKVGAMWKPKPGGKSCGTGSVTVKGWKQRFVVLKNHRKKEGSNEPDWVLMTSNEPEADNYQARDGQQRNGQRRDRDDDDRRQPPPDHDDIPF